MAPRRAIIALAVPLLAAAAAAVWYLRGGPSSPGPEEAEAEAARVEALSDAADVMTVVEDLLTLPEPLQREPGGGAR